MAIQDAGFEPLAWRQSGCRSGGLEQKSPVFFQGQSIPHFFFLFFFSFLLIYLGLGSAALCFCFAVTVPVFFPPTRPIFSIAWIEESFLALQC